MRDSQRIYTGMLASQIPLAIKEKRCYSTLTDVLLLERQRRFEISEIASCTPVLYNPEQGMKICHPEKELLHKINPERLDDSKISISEQEFQKADHLLFLSYEEMTQVHPEENNLTEVILEALFPNPENRKMLKERREQRSHKERALSLNFRIDKGCYMTLAGLNENTAEICLDMPMNNPWFALLGKAAPSGNSFLRRAIFGPF